jgi:hypothetical protein
VPRSPRFRGRDRPRVDRRNPPARCRQGFEQRHQLLGPLPPVRGPFLQAFHHQLGHGRRHFTPLGHRHGRLSHVGRENRLGRIAAKRRIARQHLVRQDAQRVDVGPMIGMWVRRRLLRGHVRRRAECDAGGGQLLPAGCLADGLGHSEIRDQRMPARQHHVLGFDVPMHDARLVRVGERVGYVSKNSRRLGHGEFALPEQLLTQ